MKVSTSSVMTSVCLLLFQVAVMHDAEYGIRDQMSLSNGHWSQIHSTKPIERLVRDVERRTDVVQIFPNEDAIVGLVGAVHLEQNDGKRCRAADQPGNSGRALR